MKDYSSIACKDKSVFISVVVDVVLVVVVVVVVVVVLPFESVATSWFGI